MTFSFIILILFIQISYQIYKLDKKIHDFQILVRWRERSARLCI